MYSPFLISVVLLGYFIVFGGFWGFCRSLHKTKSRLDRAISNEPCREAVFSPKFEAAAWIFPSDVKKKISVFSSSGQLGKKLHPFRSNSNDLCITTGAFSFPEHLVPVFSTTAQLEIKLCDRSSVTTATDRTGAQSKFPNKILLFPCDPMGAFWCPFVM